MDVGQREGRTNVPRLSLPIAGTGYAGCWGSMDEDLNVGQRQVARTPRGPVYTPETPLALILASQDLRPVEPTKEKEIVCASLG
jgi:hypothetical protein